ncbi:hypothetical protein SDC9_161777 [bioreactor metagenome]|uniref:Uncharacterized protein n=1 Tax=bioreactor metagenome TaxID=1076179 RepID=A0A645FKF9_9ZZZZ
MGTGRIEIVQCAGDEQIGVGIEVAAELLALVAQIALDLELHILGAVQVIAPIRRRAAPSRVSPLSGER